MVLRHGGLRVRVWFAALNDRLEIVGLEMWGREPIAEPWRDDLSELPETAITTSNMRMNLAPLREGWRAWQRAIPKAARQLREASGTERPRVPELDFERRLREFEDRSALPRSGRGRPPLTIERLREVARIEQEARENGERTDFAVARQMTEQLGRDVKESTARGWIRQAKNRGDLGA
jgi:hypothetical protein